MRNIALTNGKYRVSTLICRMLLIASPFLLLGLISLVTGFNAYNANPVWGDELDIWRSLFCWKSMGFDKGYSGMYEAIPQVGTLGITGITPIMLYGLFVKLFGLYPSTILIANAFWISLAAFVFCLLIKPVKAVSLTLTALILFYAPIAMYCVTSMTELFNYALIIFYLAFLVRYYHARSKSTLVMCFIIPALGCIYRGTYALLLIPTVLVYGQMKISLKTILCSIISLAVAALCYYGASLITAPSVSKFTYHFLRAESFGDMLHMLMSHGKINLLDFFTSTGSPIQDGFRALYCAVCFMCLFAAFVDFERKHGKLRLFFRISKEMLCCFILLFLSLAYVIAFFETGDWVDFRLLAPYLWFVLGFLAIRRHRIIPITAVAAGIASLIVMFSLPLEGAYSDDYRFKASPESTAVINAAQYIEYDAAAQDPFDNSVRTDLVSLEVQKAIHPGMGLQYGWFSTDTTGKSKWIFTDHLKCLVEGYELVFKDTNINVYKLTDGES